MAEPPSSPRFTPAFFGFLKELEKNNNRPWFQKNKGRFDHDVLGASLAFVEAVGPGIHQINPHLVADPRPVGGSLMRIYRDVRFSKDKSPYRTSMGIHFFHEGSKGHDGGLPGFFLHLAPGESIVAAGMWKPAPEDLRKIRTAIVEGGAAWKKAKAVGLSPDQGALKRVPPGFDADHPAAEDLRRKSFTASSELADAAVTGKGFPTQFLAECRRLDPLNRFLANAAGVDY